MGMMEKQESLMKLKRIGRQEKRGKIRKLVKDKNVDIVLIQETKNVAITDREVREIWVRTRMEFMSVDSKGTIFNSYECVLLNIYAPNDVGERRKLWDSLLNLKQGLPKPWCLCGDFNEIRHIGKRKSYFRRERGMTKLNEFIENSEVQDLPLLRRKFTWCNSREDHSPLLLMEDERNWGPKPFRFLNALCLHPNFFSFVVKKKLKDLKLALQQWNKEVYGSVPNKLKAVEKEVHNLDLQAENREQDQYEKARRRAASEEVWRLHRMMEWTSLQKSRLNWNLKGDRNTRFFHVVAKGKHCRNEIISIAFGSSVLKEPSQVKSAVFEHFKKQYFEEWVSRPKLGGIFKSMSSSPYFNVLETEFSKSEILAAVKDCEGNKALGPDGFNMLYF
ncbi:uncharacterized protein LOC114276708 [Camellia sinensis]|uniref:uncharacterized protein LOC114276708 n=1 Tax=Camellia sinensis TaxID=4442 RepID=UPI0010358955|nr:uncharacterized protein LOC114276708 [Camellia sinensis]